MWNVADLWMLPISDFPGSNLLILNKWKEKVNWKYEILNTKGQFVGFMCEEKRKIQKQRIYLNYVEVWKWQTLSGGKSLDIHNFKGNPT